MLQQQPSATTNRPHGNRQREGRKRVNLGAGAGSSVPFQQAVQRRQAAQTARSEAESA